MMAISFDRFHSFFLRILYFSSYSLSFNSHDTEVWRLSRTDPGSLHTESAGADLARQVPAVQRVPCPAERQVLRPQWTALLQGGLLQVSKFLKRTAR